MLKIAHRGASGHAPENTALAFTKALELGADGVELDVHRCKTGELVVIHDDTVNRTTNGRGRVAEMTLEQLKQLRIAPLESIPTLAETVALLRDANCFIEVKHADAALLAAQQIERHAATTGQPERLWLISFDHGALKETIKQYPAIQIGASFEKLTHASVKEAHALGAKAIIPHHLAVKENHIAQAHALGLNVFVWTLNTPADITRAKALGVDGIMSDYPERL